MAVTLIEHCAPIHHKLTFVQLLRWYKIVIGPLQSCTKTAYFELQRYSKLPFFPPAGKVDPNNKLDGPQLTFATVAVELTGLYVWFGQNEKCLQILVALLVFQTLGLSRLNNGVTVYIYAAR